MKSERGRRSTGSAGWCSSHRSRLCSTCCFSATRGRRCPTKAPALTSPAVDRRARACFVPLPRHGDWALPVRAVRRWPYPPPSWSLRFQPSITSSTTTTRALPMRPATTLASEHSGASGCEHPYLRLRVLDDGVHLARGPAQAARGFLDGLPPREALPPRGGGRAPPGPRSWARPRGPRPRPARSRP